MRLNVFPVSSSVFSGERIRGHPSAQASVSGVILGPLVMRHCYFGGFGLGPQFDSCA